MPGPEVLHRLRMCHLRQLPAGPCVRLGKSGVSPSKSETTASFDPTFVHVCFRARCLKSVSELEAAVLGSPSLTVRMVSVDSKATLNLNPQQSSGAVCESRGGRPGLPVPNSPYGLRGRKAILKH